MSSTLSTYGYVLPSFMRLGYNTIQIITSPSVALQQEGLPYYTELVCRSLLTKNFWPCLRSAASVAEETHPSQLASTPHTTLTLKVTPIQLLLSCIRVWQYVAGVALLATGFLRAPGREKSNHHGETLSHESR